MKKIKIARVCPYYYEKKENLDSGLKPYYYNLIKELEKNNIKNDIYTLESDSDKDNVIIIPRRRRFSYLLFGYDVYKNLKDKEYNIIHTHQTSAFLLYFFKKKLKAKFVHTIHGSPLAYKKVPIKSLTTFKDVIYFYLFNKYICKRADAIITVSSEARDEVIKNLKINENKVSFIPTGVDVSLFKEKKTNKDIDILYVGRFATKKNLLNFIRIIYKLKSNLPNIKAYLIGGVKTDLDYYNIINFINELKLKENVVLIPPVNNYKISDYYNRAKIFMLLSYEEGLPKVLLEAMACGVIPITSNNSGMKDVIINGKNGYLVDIKNHDEIINKIIELLNNNKLKIEKDYIKNNFSWKIITQKIIKLYNKIL